FVMILCTHTSILFPYTTLFRSFLDQGYKFLFEQGNVVEAEKAFRQAISLQPKDISNIGESIRRSFADITDERDWSTVVGLYEMRSEEHTSELQSLRHLVCRLLL